MLKKQILYLIQALFLIKSILATDISNLFQVNQKPTSLAAQFIDLPANIINDLLQKCSKVRSIEQCDMCVLCQNGAICKQNTKRQTYLLPTSTIFNQNLNSLAYLKSMIDLKCYCEPGFTGTYCQIDVNECIPNPCTNNATCIDRVNHYECKCPSGYAGEHCEININECDSSPCYSQGGKCVDLTDGYFCSCFPGFTGPTCSINVDECASQPCMNNGVCIDLVNGYECNCTGTGFDGKLCENNINDCQNIICENNSTCIDGVNSFKCDCHPGYEGKFCEIDIDECQSSPCVFGTCWQNSDQNSILRKVHLLNQNNENVPFRSADLKPTTSIDLSFGLSFNYTKAYGYWCECEPGFTGVNCEIKIDECQSSPCGSNGRCIDLVNGYKCLCYPGYTGRTCTENIDECKLFSPCADRTKCIDLKPDYASLLTTHKSSDLDDDYIYLDGYYCDCSDLNENLYKQNGNRDVIYAGQNCTLRLNACESLKHMCKHDSVCQSILFNSTEQDIMCLCKPGYTGKYCEYSTTFRLDGVYSIDYKIENMIRKFDLKFEFKTSFFDKFKQPLINFRYQHFLMFEFILYHDFIEIRNDNFNLNEKLAFLNTNDLNNNYQSVWSLIEIQIDNNELHVYYSIKHIMLSVSKTIDLLKYPGLLGLLPTSFNIGKYFNQKDNYDSIISLNYLDYKNDNYLSDTCIRDLSLNGDYLFKTLKFDYLNHDFETVVNDVRVKFGCNVNNQMLVYHDQCQEKNNESKNDKNLNICMNNSTCVNKLFNYQCLNCNLPFYGKNCQEESTKLVFMRQEMGKIDLDESYLELNIKKINSEIELNSLNSFKFEFKLHRFVYKNSDLIKINDFNFLLFKKLNENDETTLNNYYLFSINSDGYLSLKKYQSENNIDLASLQTESTQLRPVWTLINNKINLNQLSTSYTSHVGLKLNDHLIELCINDTHVSRFELINELTNNSMFEVDYLKLSNSITNFHFIMYDFKINDNFYMFKYEPDFRQLGLIILDKKFNYLFRTFDFIQSKYLILYNSTELIDDFELIEDLNLKNNLICSALNENLFENYDLLNTNSINNNNNNNNSKLTNYSISITNGLVVSHDKKTCYESLNSRFRNKPSEAKSSKKLSILSNLTCEFKRIQDLNGFYSTCENYSVIKRKLFNQQTYTTTNNKKSNPSIISYNFDFENPSSNLNQIQIVNVNNTNEIVLSKQRRVILLQDVEFYTLSFNLNLNQISEDIENKQEIKTNFLTLNALDDLTTNRIFLFGLNLIIIKTDKVDENVNNSIKYKFEIYTNKHSIKTDFISLSNENLVNLTFSYNSIEIRLDNNDNYLQKLTDRYFNLFFRSLLKAYGSFQLNITSSETVKISSSINSNLFSACISNFKLGTRKQIESTNDAFLQYQFNYYSLIHQTKSISFYQSDLNDIEFDSTCDDRQSVDQTSPKSKSGYTNSTFDKCFLVTKFDHTKEILNDFYDCNCDNNLNKCSFTFWTKDTNELMDHEIEQMDKKRSCIDLDEYACFNNGTCYDKPFTTNELNYGCKCKDSYTGNRCEKFDPCLNNPCSVNSTCIPQILNNDQITYECKCFPGFLGRNCTIKFDETCLASPCLNGATCINVTSFDEPQKLTYECMCPIGYEGKRCEKRIDYCKLFDPCKNGALCHNQDHLNSFYKCSCAKGWTGVNCTQDIDECAQMKSKSIISCFSHGRCVNSLGSYKCICDNFYYGKNCEHIHTCKQNDNPCSNGGVCTVFGDIDDNIYKCDCKNGYTGTNCTIPTCNSRLCQHNSVCFTRNETSFECNCTGTGYAGLYCENLINEAACKQRACFGNQTCDRFRCNCDTINCDELSRQYKSSPKDIVYHLVIWPLLAIMLILLSILFSIFTMKIKKSRATRGTYSPSRHEQQASRIEFNMDLKIPPEERLI